MSPDSTPREVPPAGYCGSYRRGHDVHFTQARLTWEMRRDEHRTVRHIADDGTITFTDNTTVWNHDPGRLRTVLAPAMSCSWAPTECCRCQKTEAPTTSVWRTNGIRADPKRPSNARASRWRSSSCAAADSFARYEAPRRRADTTLRR